MESQIFTFNILLVHGKGVPINDTMNNIVVDNMEFLGLYCVWRLLASCLLISSPSFFWDFLLTRLWYCLNKILVYLSKCIGFFLLDNIVSVRYSLTKYPF